MTKQLPMKQKIDDLKTLFAKYEAESAKLLQGVIAPERLTRLVVDAAIKNPKLADCTPPSLVGAMLTCAALQLEPGVANQCWIIPYGKNATFVPGYQGLAQLAYRSSRISTLVANVAYSKDSFKYTDAPPLVEHTRHEGEDRGEFTHAYAGAQNVNGHWQWVVMQAWEVEKVRKRSAAATSSGSPWSHPDDVNEMRKKTAFKRLFKWLPMSIAENAPLARAIELDNLADQGLSQELEADVVDFDDVQYDGPKESEQHSG